MRFKKCFTIMLVLAVLTAGNVTAAGEALEVHETGLPTEWDLSAIYPSKEDWQKDYNQAMDLLDQCENFRGTLHTAENIYAYYQFRYFGELTGLQGKLNTYASLGNYLDPTDAIFHELLSQMDAMERKESTVTAFAGPEIYELPLEQRKKIFSDPLFEDFFYAVEEYTYPYVEPYSEEETELLSTLSIGNGYASRIFDILDSVELPDPVITMPDGTKEVLTEQLYDDIFASDAYDDAFREEADQVLLTKPKALKHTFSMLLEEHAAQTWADAQISGYDTTRQSELAKNDLDPEVYDLLIEAAHTGVKGYQRYLKAHAKGLGQDVQSLSELGIYLSDFDPGQITYEDAVADVADALAILGGEYVDTYWKIVNNGHVDVYPDDKKDTGSFEIQLDYDSLPWVLLNFYGDPEDVSTIAHELGHAVYDAFSSENQNPLCASPKIFTQEIASTVNELLYNTYKVEQAADAEERLFYLENLLSMFSETFFTQALYAEFEDDFYQTVEAGGALDAEALSDKWMELDRLYLGDAVENYPDYRYQWATIPHFYYTYYVYQYAADICYAASISNRILSGDEEALESYLAFLKKGDSVSPTDLLEQIGIDPMSPDTYQYALDYYSGLVDEYERLVVEG